MQLYRPSYMYLVPAFVEIFYSRIWKTIEKQGKTKLFNKINDFELLPEDKSKELFDLCLFNFPDIIPSKEELS